ncbi:hypothetical protein D1872_272250 [compost metagenome]
MSELHQQIIARTNDTQNLIQSALEQERLGAASTNGMVLDLYRIAEKVGQHLSPASLWLPVWIVGLHR